MKILFTPEEKHLLQIKTWLHKEMLEKKSYFYYNFINADFDIHNFACCVNECDEALGFMDYTFSGKYTHINVAVVQFEHQRKGIGKMLLDAVAAHVNKQGTVVLSLECEPKNSERRWKKLGFKNFKEIENHRFLNSGNSGRPWLYKIIVPHKKTTKRLKPTHYIELWTDFEHVVDSRKLLPNYKWDVTELSDPIIHPVDYDWKIRLMVNSEIIYDGKIKRFNFSFSDHGNFLVVEKLMY